MMRRVTRLIATILAAAMFINPPSSGAPASSQVGHGPPDQMLGLNVVKEDIAKVLSSDKRALYVDRVGLYSLREPSKLLQATLEINHFRSLAPIGSEDFQLSIVGAIGSTSPIVVRTGSQAVYITTKKGLLIALWFNHDYMLALAIRRTYMRPKELLREALKVNP